VLQAGPLFYGFSDVHVQRAIAAMYTAEEMAEFLAKNNATMDTTAMVREAAGSGHGTLRAPEIFLRV
jgi:coenzyme F420-reducing hydrogenase alpha subunit